MNNKQKKLNLLGLATKAGLLVTGDGSVLDEIRKKSVKLVIVATDCSENTKKKFKDKCQYYGVNYIEEFTMVEISQAIGKMRAIVAFSNDGFIKKYQSYVD